MASDTLTTDETRDDLATQPRAVAIGPETVKAYIRAHPELVTSDPELLGALVPQAYTEDGLVYDMQRFAIDQLKQRHDEVVRQRDRALEAMRVNAAVSERMQNAVLTILDARSLEDMIGVITNKLATAVDVDRIVLCMEESQEGMIDDLPAAEQLGVRIVPECYVDAVLGEGITTRLEGDKRGSANVFKEDADFVKSYALVRLAISPIAPPGMLAIGSANPFGFDPSQGTEQLEFLARVIERQVRAWLGLPQD